jgi:hypothetical protein
MAKDSNCKTDFVSQRESASAHWRPGGNGFKLCRLRFHSNENLVNAARMKKNKTTRARATFALFISRRGDDTLTVEDQEKGTER